MMLHVGEVLTKEQVAQFRAQLDAADWVDGNVTAGHQSALVKRNLQLPEDSPVARQLGGAILNVLATNGEFMSAALPAKIYPPMFNRYEGGGTFGNHVDNSIRHIAGTPHRLRTDLSVTLFLAEPEEYEGGELLVDDTYGTHRAKLPAGDLVLYPSTSLHRVTPVTRGARVASFFWLQSMVRDDSQRTLLYQLDNAIQALAEERGHTDERVVELTGIYHNLIRQWAVL